jgi:hypothetical protein
VVTLDVVPGPTVELLWWDGCPSTERARRELRGALDDVGLTATEIGLREIRTDAEAQADGFTGSPTILIDGTDVEATLGEEAPAPAEPAGLGCRVYRRHDGRISPTPDPEDLRDALRRALASAEPSRVRR